MFDYALKNDRYIGMVQPSELSGSSSGNAKSPSLYNIGCAGFVTAFSQTNDKRYEIILEGVCRFKIKKELEIKNGFRRANVQWSKFKSDFNIENLTPKEKREEFLKILRPFFEKMSMNVDWEMIEGTNDEDLINTNFESKLAPEAQYRIGSIYEIQLNDDIRAIQAYDDLIAR